MTWWEELWEVMIHGPSIKTIREQEQQQWVNARELMPLAKTLRDRAGLTARILGPGYSVPSDYGHLLCVPVMLALLDRIEALEREVARKGGS